MRWKKEEIEKAKNFLKLGFNYKKISIEIDRTVSSVKNKLQEYGLNFKQINITSEIRKCKHCCKEFEVNKSNPKIFCNKSCAASYNNKKYKTKHKEEIICCLGCKKEIENNKVGNRKYCNNICQGNFKRNEIFKKIEKGEHKSDNPKIYKLYLIEKHGEKCMECDWTEKNKFSNKIPLELHHIDCNPDNNKENNLQLLCPNCHSLTKNWKGITKGQGRFSRRRVKRRQNYKNEKSY